MKLTDKIMQMPIEYGGKIVPLGQIWVDVLRTAPNVKCAERFIQGLLLKQEIDKRKEQEK